MSAATWRPVAHRATTGAKRVRSLLMLETIVDLAATDGKSFTVLPWNTSIIDYANLHGHRLAAEGTAMWDAPAPEGHFAYIEFSVDDLAYNVAAPAIPDDAGQTATTAELAGAS